MHYLRFNNNGSTKKFKSLISNNDIIIDIQRNFVYFILFYFFFFFGLYNLDRLFRFWFDTSILNMLVSVVYSLVHLL